MALTAKGRRAAACAAALCVILLKNRRRKIKRRFKMRPLNRRRNQIGYYATRYTFMRTHDASEFFKYTRMTVEKFDELLNLVRTHLQKDISKLPLAPECRLIMTLHFLAYGCSLQQLAWDYCVGKSTVHYVVLETCKVLWDVLQPQVLQVPTHENWTTIKNGFFIRWNFPNCLGAIDGKHITIQAPENSGSDFFNYKKSHSIVLLAACDAFYKFTVADIGAPGSNHDSTVFSNSEFGRRIIQRDLNIPRESALPNTRLLFPQFFVADAAFPLNKHLMKPYSGKYLGERKNIFNYRLSRARRTIENTFGILAQRWRILLKPIIAKVENCEIFVKATVVLHNFVQDGEEHIPPSEGRNYSTGFGDCVDNDGTFHDRLWGATREPLQSVGRQQLNDAARNIQKLRETLCDWCNSPAGALTWQQERALIGSVPI